MTITQIHQETNRYLSQIVEHERILADLQVKFDPAKKADRALLKRLAEIEDRLFEP